MGERKTSDILVEINIGTPNHESLIITDYEEIFLKAYKENDLVSDAGWDSGESLTWVAELSYWAQRDFGLKSTSIPGIVSSLVKKGLMKTDGISITITDKGILVLKELEKI